MVLLQEKAMTISYKRASNMDTFLQHNIEYERMMAYAEGKLAMLRYMMEKEIRCPCCGAKFKHGVLENGGSLLQLLRRKVLAPRIR